MHISLHSYKAGFNEEEQNNSLNKPCSFQITGLFNKPICFSYSEQSKYCCICKTVFMHHRFISKSFSDNISSCCLSNKNKTNKKTLKHTCKHLEWWTHAIHVKCQVNCVGCFCHGNKNNNKKTPTHLQSQDKETWTFDKSQHGKSSRRRDVIETKWHMQKENLAVGKKCHQGWNELYKSENDAAFVHWFFVCFLFSIILSTVLFMMLFQIHWPQRKQEESSSSNWILMSCHPHRVTSGQSNS